MDLEKFFEEESNEEEFSLDIRRYIRGIYKRKWIVLAIFLIILVPWLLYVRSQPPEYEAYTWIRFKNYDPDQLRALNNSWFIELTSRTFAEKVVAQLGLTLDLLDKDKKAGLMRQDVFETFYTNENPVPGKYKLRVEDSLFTLYRLSMDEKHQKKIAEGPVSAIEDTVFTINGFSFKVKPEFFQLRKEITFIVHNFRSAVSWFQSHVQVNLGRGGTLMKIRMVHDNPVMVAQMVNRLAEIFVEESISFEKKKALEYKKALQNRLKIAEEQLKRDQEELKRFKETHFISLDTDIQNKVEELSNLEAQKRNIEASKENLAELISKLNELGNPKIDSQNDMPEVRYIFGQIAKNPLFQDNTEMGILGEKLKSLEARRKALLKSVTAVHPDVQEIDKQINEVYDQILFLAKEELKKADVNIRRIERQIAQLRRSVRNLPSEQLKLANLSQRVEISKKLYSDLLSKSQEVQISEAADAEEIDILDPAIPPEYPKNRGKKKLAILGILLALVFSVGSAIALEFLDKTIKSPDDVKKYLKLEVIGTIPKVHFDNEYELNDSDKLRQIDSQLVTYDYSPTPIGEAYRALRTKIVFSKKTGKLRSLLITSFAPGDGKSFTASNLAVTLAQHKSNTLLIDADLRRGVLHNTFGLQKEPGLSNYLIGMVRFEDILQETHVPNLTLVSCGSMMPNPSELLGSVQLQRFVEEAKRRFDIVVFDTPPLNAATDAVVLGTQVDGVVLIARAEVTNRNIAKQKLTLFENVPANILGVVLNGAEADLAHEGYSYYHY